MSVQVCPGLINSSYEHVNLPPVRIVLLSDCQLLSTLVINSIISAIKRPLELTFRDNFIDIFMDILNNKSDISGNYNTLTYDKINIMYCSSIMAYSSSIAILSGKIYAKTGNNFSLFSSFTGDLWILFGLSLIIVANINTLLHLFEKPLTFSSFLISFLKNLFELLMDFYLQSSQNFSRICCAKHLLLNSTSLMSIFLLTNFFTSNILSILLHNPLVKIDSLNDVVELISKNYDIEVIADYVMDTGRLIQEWPDESINIISENLKDVSILNFDYEKVFSGKAIIISHELVFNTIYIMNPQLKFHIGEDKHYGNALGLLYSKNIDPTIKTISDSVINKLFESGSILSYFEGEHVSKIKLKEFVNLHESISIVYFKQIVIFFMYIIIILFIILLLEYAHSKMLKIFIVISYINSFQICL